MGARGWVLGVIGLVAIGLALFVVDFPRPMSDDMAPNIRKGDLLLACRVCGQPTRGDVVVFTPPGGGEATTQLRRVVAVPGDKVEVRRGVVLVNGEPLTTSSMGTVQLAGIDPVSTRPRIFERWTERTGGHEYPIVRDPSVALAGDRPPVVLDGAYFVAADRRTLVRDSREYGPVPRASVRSIALRILTTGDHDSVRQGRLP
jgi:signal peptidase I